MHRRRLLAGFVALLLVGSTVLAGCGSGNPMAPTGTSTRVGQEPVPPAPQGN